MDKKLAETLWSARWAVRHKKDDEAFKQITKALVHIGAEKEVETPEIERPDEPMPEDFMKGIAEPAILKVKGVKYNEFRYQTISGMFSGLVVHYTVSGRSAQSARNVVSYLASKGLGCMVMDLDGLIYVPESFDIFRDAAAHAGTSKWGNLNSLNNKFAGMEICCWGRGSKEGPFRESKGEENIIAGKYQTFTEAQENSLINFILWAKTKNPEFKIENVVGHDEIRAEAGRKGDKQDPGASLSMTMPRFREFLTDKAKTII